MPVAGLDDLEVLLDAGRLVLRFNRPDALNALTPGMLEKAADRIHAASGDPEIRVVVITGIGRAFSSGADIGDGGTDVTGTLDGANHLVHAIVHSAKPVVAGVNGLAAGVGATIALSCDLQVVRGSAYLLLAFANIGLMPDGGATAIVPAAIGRARASRMALLGERIPAAQALEWGLVSHVADDDAYDNELEALVAKLANGPTLAYGRTKAALADATLAGLDAAHTTERAGQLALFDTADYVEGTAAFRERRTAEFHGR
ncbi:enoyl-CoA hydratase [uncultured Jatrophihabitans sp.]|uniref:enoyl-CoA hydratase n=1 Tax=uncultured Jatrophihabitans sp. TaxID=1610747 RepID=UPI0035CB2D86